MLTWADLAVVPQHEQFRRLRDGLKPLVDELMVASASDEKMAASVVDMLVAETDNAVLLKLIHTTSTTGSTASGTLGHLVEKAAEALRAEEEDELAEWALEALGQGVFPPVRGRRPATSQVPRPGFGVGHGTRCQTEGWLMRRPL